MDWDDSFRKAAAPGASSGGCRRTGFPIQRNFGTPVKAVGKVVGKVAEKVWLETVSKSSFQKQNVKGEGFKLGGTLELLLGTSRDMWGA